MASKAECLLVLALVHGVVYRGTAIEPGRDQRDELVSRRANLEHDSRQERQILETLLLEPLYAINDTIEVESTGEFGDDESSARLGDTWYIHCRPRREKPLESYLYITQDRTGPTARPIVLKYLEDFESFVKSKKLRGSLDENLKLFHEEVDASSIYGARLTYCDAARALAYRALITGREFYARDASSTYRNNWK